MTARVLLDHRAGDRREREPRAYGLAVAGTRRADPTTDRASRRACAGRAQVLHGEQRQSGPGLECHRLLGPIQLRCQRLDELAKGRPSSAERTTNLHLAHVDDELPGPVIEVRLPPPAGRVDDRAWPVQATSTGRSRRADVIRTCAATLGPAPIADARSTRVSASDVRIVRCLHLWRPAGSMRERRIPAIERCGRCGLSGHDDRRGNGGGLRNVAADGG